MEKVAEIDTAGDFASARDLIDAALQHYPRVPALAIANAYFVKQGRPIG